MYSPTSFVVVGGGLSGTLLAARLLSRARHPIRIAVIDTSDRVGEGVAYRTRHPEHLLNVRAKAMSGVAGDTEHFVRWLGGPGREAAARWGADADPEAFLPRALYAEYIGWVLSTARESATSGSMLEWVCGDAIAVEPRPEGAIVTLRGGRSVEASGVVLALGNAPPAHPTERDDPFYRTDRYVRDPWSELALDGIGAHAPVLIAGTGLTMVDVAVALSRAGHRGTITAISRRGLWPLEHRAAPPAPEFINVNRPPATIRALLHAARESAGRASSNGADWRPVLDSIRPHVARLWLALPPAERARFLRHLRPYWDIHRHRAAPSNMRDIERMRSDGQLVLRAGRIRGYRTDETGVDVTLQPRGQLRTETIRAERVINATGPESDYRRIGSPLIERLLRDRLVRPGPFGCGLDAGVDGVLLDAAGAPSRFLFTLGPPLRGVLWETTAVPEIRDQADALAARLLADAAAG